MVARARSIRASGLNAPRSGSATTASAMAAVKSGGAESLNGPGKGPLARIVTAGGGRSMRAPKSPGWLKRWYWSDQSTWASESKGWTCSASLHAASIRTVLAAMSVASEAAL